MNDDVNDANADWPDGTKFDRVKLNVEPVCDVARRKTSTITVFESNDDVELTAEKFANIKQNNYL